MKVVTDKPTTKAVPKGYKRTEVGVIPEDWEMLPIKDLAHIGTGSKNTEDKIDDGKYPFFVRSSKVERINSYSFDGEAVLTAGDGVNTGKIFHYIDGKFDYHQRVYKISNFNNDIDGYYFYLVFSQYFYERVMGMTAKSSVDSVRMEMIADMKLPFPPTLEEQQAIAESLSDVDALIAELDALIEKKQQLKKGTMQLLLSEKKRLPGFDGEWVEKELDKLSLDITSSKRIMKNEYEKTGIPFFRSKEIIEKSDNKYEGSGNYISQKRFNEIKRTYNIPQKGEVLITAVGTLGISYLIQDKDTPFYFKDGNLLWLREINEEVILPNYLLLCLKTESFKKQIKTTTGGSSQSALTIVKLKKFRISLPSTIKEQKAIARILSDMDAEIRALQAKRAKYEQIKQGMMQELLTGKVRLV